MPFLLGDAFDFFAVGGVSLALPLAIAFFLHGAYPGGDWLFGPSQIFWFLLVLPHYTSSYQLLYWDYARDILRRPGHMAAAVAVPGVCLCLLASVLAYRPLVPMYWLVQALFFLSGWHYAKQAYGCSVALSAARGVVLGAGEALAARVNLLALSVLAFARPNQEDRFFPYGGLSYHSLGLPAWPSALAALVWGLSGGLVAVYSIRRMRRGERPPWVAVAAFLSFYCWALPLALMPGKFHAFRDVPFVAALHSLQYLVFVASLRLSRLETRGRLALDARALETAAGVVGAAVLGHLVFIVLPRWADFHVAYDRAALGAGFFAASAALFVNVHHYFIDAVVWRGNPDLRALVRAKAA